VVQVINSIGEDGDDSQRNRCLWPQRAGLFQADWQVRMNRTYTRIVDYQRLSDRREGAGIVVRLMMACNDMQLANEALSSWTGEQPRKRQHRQNGARMYFVRLQMAHLYEALKIVDEIRKHTGLHALVSSCDNQTQASFRNLVACLKGGVRHSWFEKFVGRVRHSLAFHYEESGDLIARAIADRASRTDARYSSVTRGSTAYLWHFQVADELVESIAVREIWRIPRDKDVGAEIDGLLDDMHEVFLIFINFSGEFIWRFFSR